MPRTLYDLSKDDWNTLFPVELVDHNPKWAILFEEEKRSIFLGVDKDSILQIEHFGSTSIPNIKAKPYIDIIIAIPENLLFDQTLIDYFEHLGYTYFLVPERDNIPAYMSFGKGYGPKGYTGQVFHLHVCPKNHFMWKQISFRDYLVTHPESAKKYEQLKLESAKKHKNDRGKYVLSKTEFINEILEKA